MSYSQEEIEKKRLLALQRKKEAQSKHNNTPGVNKFPNNSPSIISGNRNFQNGYSNTSPPHGHEQNKYTSAKRSFTKNNTIGSTRCKQADRYNPIATKSFFGQKTHITGKCYMISNHRFTLDTSRYCPPLIETLKTIPSKAYDIKTKTWNFHLNDYETLMQKIIAFKSDVQVTGLPMTVLQIFRKNVPSESALSNVDLSDIDSKLVESLMPFQRDGVCYGISKGGRCMIADDMGLGKTIQALGIAYYFRKNWPLLIVVPSSVRYQWADAIYTFLPSVPTHYIHHFSNTKDFVDNDKIVITSYDLLVRAVTTFERRFFGFVILDESHVLKSIKTARYKAVQRVVLQSRHLVLLSGTPALSRPIELYSQINLIVPHFMGYQDYGIRYCAGEKALYGWDFTGSSNMQELQMLLKNTCMIRRLKSEVLNQLPTKKREVVMLDPDLIKVGTEDMVEMSKKLERKVLTSTERHNALLQYYNETSIAKLKAVCDYVAKLFKNKKKCLIFAHHQKVLDAICDVAESVNIKYIRIDGKTNPERRKYQVDKFQNCDDYLAAVLSITAANAGITLTSAQLVVFAELFWNPGILCQAEDRVHRIGQNEDVIIQYLVAKQTADDYLWPLIQRKMNVLNAAGLDQDFSLSDINITKQALSKGQKTLNFFMNDMQSPDTDDEKTVKRIEETDQSTTIQNSSCVEAEEFKDLIELDEEDFNFCDWDDMT